MGPIAISVDASQWQHYETGVFNGCSQSDPEVDHAVQLVGYSETEDGLPYWIGTFKTRRRALLASECVVWLASSTPPPPPPPGPRSV